MRSVLISLGVLGVTSFCFVPNSVEGQHERGSVAEAIDLFDNGDLTESARMLKDLLASETLALDQRTTARKYIAWTHLLRREEQEAVDVFKELVAEDPSFGIDDLSVEEGAPSGDAIQYLGRAALEVRHHEAVQRQARLSATSRNQALLRSAVVPGWGQRYSGYRGRSLAMLGIAAGAIVYAISTDNSFRTARDDYQGAAEGAEFDKLYDNYKNKGDTADLALGIVAAAWALNLLDATFSGPNLAGLELAANGRVEDSQELQLAFVKRF